LLHTYIFYITHVIYNNILLKLHLLVSKICIVEKYLLFGILHEFVTEISRIDSIGTPTSDTISNTSISSKAEKHTHEKKGD
jgi:hypothetical protein